MTVQIKVTISLRNGELLIRHESPGKGNNVGVFGFTPKQEPELWASLRRFVKERFQLEVNAALASADRETP